MVFRLRIGLTHAVGFVRSWLQIGHFPGAVASSLSTPRAGSRGSGGGTVEPVSLGAAAC